MGGEETELLEDDVSHCPSSGDRRSCWERGSNAGEFVFHGPSGNSCTFSVSASRLNRGACSVVGLDDL